LIMGAGGLLGSHLVQECLAQNAMVIAIDSKLEQAKSKLEGIGVNYRHSSLDCRSLDVTNEFAVKNFFASLDHIDGAVNATYPRNKKYGAHFFDVTMSSFNDNLALHLGSSFLFTQQCANWFRKHQIPLSVVNISSIYGVIAPKFEIYKNTLMTMPVEYAAIKSALLHLNKYVVAYVNDSRFRINAVSPGGIFDNQPEVFCEAYKHHTNGMGMLPVSDIIGSIIFLLSDNAKYVTGQNIVVDDGFSL
ncbi:SDR family oxidoreductase, partial [Salmonella enterica]|nr:SDR family oxidoreductase [Salmonella enterica]EEJ8003721.1 SDR family oxidoreductase [Salmonella enterica]